MVNKIWSFLIIIGILFSLILGNTNNINKEILISSKKTLDMIIQIFPVMALWLGIMNIAKHSGLINKLSSSMGKLLKKIFPEIPSNNEALGYITSNIFASMFGFGNVATPFGLKAMKSLQELNPKKDTASRSMITFLVINTSGLSIIPTTIISLRVLHNSKNPTSVIALCFISSLLSCIIGLIIDRTLAKRSKKYERNI